MKAYTDLEQSKKLLLKDLAARLPYGVIVQYPNIFRPSEVIKRRLEEISYSLIGIDEYKININDDGIEIGYLKPYLRPMSSMTKEEGLEFYNLCKDFHDYELFPCYLEDNKGNLEKHLLWYTIKMDLFDWLNAHHFDYRGLIEKGLAIEAPKGMYD